MIQCPSLNEYSFQRLPVDAASGGLEYKLEAATLRPISVPCSYQSHLVVFSALDNQDAFMRIKQAQAEAPQSAQWAVARLWVDGCDITDKFRTWSNGSVLFV